MDLGAVHSMQAKAGISVVGRERLRLSVEPLRRASKLRHSLATDARELPRSGVTRGYAGRIASVSATPASSNRALLYRLLQLTIVAKFASPVPKPVPAARGGAGEGKAGLDTRKGTR
jgi:hypothetical protein